jgi:hypothetical protein
MTHASLACQVERGGQPFPVTELWGHVHLRQGRSFARPHPSDDELELERDMEYFVGPEEALGLRIGEPDTGASDHDTTINAEPVGHAETQT